MAKAPGAFRSISEAAAESGVPQHTLRAWEERFAFVKPVKRPDGRRYYRPGDVALLREIARRLAEGGSADEVRRLHMEGALRPSALAASQAASLEEALRALEAARRRLRVALSTTDGLTGATV